MMISNVGSPRILAASSVAPVYDPTAPAPAEATTVQEAVSQTSAASDPATAKAEVELRFALEFGVRLSVQGAADSDAGVETDTEESAVQAYEDHPDGQDRASRLARSMTHALGQALHHGLRAIFTGASGHSLSVEDRQQLRELEHELRHALKDAFRSNETDGSVDLLGYATETLAAVQDFTQGFKEVFGAETDDGTAADGGTTTDATDVSTTTATTDAAPTADGSEPRVHRGRHGHHDHGLHFRRHDGASFSTFQDRFGQVSGLLERITAQLQDLVDSLQPAETGSDAQDGGDAVVDPTTGGKAELTITGSLSLDGSISLVA